VRINDRNNGSRHVFHLKDDTTQIETVSRKLGAGIDSLNLEREAPSRICTIDDAVIPIAEQATSPPWAGRARGGSGGGDA
jgi:hypothetical protein